VTPVERQKGSRRSCIPVELPLEDSQGVFVIQERRRLPDRRKEQHDLDDLDDKVHYLKTAVYITPLQYALNKHDSMVLSRVLDEITIDELSFLLERHGPGNFVDSCKSEGFNDADMFTSNGERTIGLMNLGLLSRRATGGKSNNAAAFHFTPLADRLVNLFISKTTKNKNPADSKDAHR
jgi:hypothetical protein